MRGNFLNLMKSFLENGHQYAEYDNSVSQKLKLNYGVPRGSVLGPLLFLLYNLIFRKFVSQTKPVCLQMILQFTLLQSRTLVLSIMKLRKPGDGLKSIKWQLLTKKQLHKFRKTRKLEDRFSMWKCGKRKRSYVLRHPYRPQTELQNWFRKNSETDEQVFADFCTKQETTLQKISYCFYTKAMPSL